MMTPDERAKQAFSCYCKDAWLAAGRHNPAHACYWWDEIADVVTTAQDEMREACVRKLEEFAAPTHGIDKVWMENAASALRELEVNG